MNQQTVSRYRIINKLGSGGMGEVYLAEDTTLHRKVAIKFLPTQSAADERARKRLLREAQAAATLDHPNICSIYEVSHEADQSFIVMQYLEGETLCSKIHRGRLPLKESLGFAVQIADALAEAHAHGIIHRDIKPQNVMCTPRGEAKVMDFGLAKIASDDEVGSASEANTKSLLTEPGSVMGTLIYMSPEQVKGEDLDVRSDLFSLGSLLYEMFTGKQPFASTNSAGTISAILTQHPAPLTRYSDVPAELQRIVWKCLEKDRERRYSSARDLLVDLRNLKSDSEQSTLGTRAVTSRRVDPKWIYVAALMALIVVASAVFYFYRQRAQVGSSIHSVAILPFANTSADPSIDYLGDGLTESLINSLSKLAQLKVIARTTAFRYKGKDIDPQLVGRELQVDAIITGSVTKQGDTLIIQSDLLNASDGSQMWGGRYSRKVADIFAVQEQIAKEISGALPLTPTGQETLGLSKRYTNNIDAYQNYLQGQRYAQRRTRDDVQKAIAYYQKAIQTDESYALAYTGLADAYTQLVTRQYIDTREGAGAKPVRRQ
jgi:eukaryotic-like serine/threonine-protein kinase